MRAHRGDRRPSSGAAMDLRDRVAANNQLLLSAIVGTLFIVGFATQSLRDPELFGLGVLIIVAGAAASLAVPWTRISPVWVAVIPLVDIGAITILRASDPSAGLGLLWAFPMLWLSSLGRWAFLLASVLVTTIYWVVVVISGETERTYAYVLLPMLMVAIGWASYSATRRSSAQRTLLDRQTERLSAALAQANRQEQLVTEVLDTVDFGVIRIDASGTVTFVNDALGGFRQRIPGFGRVDEDIVSYGEDGTTPVLPDERPLARALRGEEFSDVIVWFPLSESKRIALSFTARALLDHLGRSAGSVLVARDVTAERSAMRARDTLVASVSHELRTPLTSILGYLDLALDSDDLTPNVRRQVDTAHRNSERLLAIVADILSASTDSRLSAGVAISPQQIDLADLVRASVSDLSVIADERAIAIDASAVEHVGAYVDAARMRQVVDNIVGNAIKFNRDGGLVTLSTGSAGDAAVIRVADTGIGVRGEERERVFERFFRAESSVPGNGLGLAISREIVGAHGGHVDLESEPGVGSVFTVSVPRDAQAFARAIVVESGELP
ncbi:PAS domain-containing sensor histidine kinase [Microbacterium memoriense]|uniref:histidine kinase n=1 Tax=Microbacterium memoriense TaxID=2978350 RepID=A0ABT2P949_9MICO|nr:PAS domain-containing sensor histidine kinase [Microbacterium memoriense]MCT9001159.1 ATP-binding protein [Microbacterium memoriense]